MSAISLSPTPVFNPNDLEKITSIDSTLDESLKVRDFKKAINHCLSLNGEEAKNEFKKIVESIQGANLNKKELEEIEVFLIKKELKNYLEFFNLISEERPCKPITNTLWDLFVFYVAWFQPAFPKRNSYKLLSLSYILPFWKPVLRKTENRLGLDAGIVASGFFGVDPLPAVGIGLSTALAMRIPVIQNVYKTAIDGFARVVGS